MLRPACLLVALVLATGCAGPRDTVASEAAPPPAAAAPPRAPRPPRTELPAAPFVTATDDGTSGVRPAWAGAPLVFALDRPAAPTRGLVGRHVAVWPSHGWYYNNGSRRWLWQRARLFTTVEDVLPFAFVQPYLAPMLERAGAVVLMPRERDTQVAESIVDNDGGPATTGRYAESGAWRAAGTGFAYRPPYGPSDLPFAMGTAREATTTPNATAEAVWTFTVPAEGDYAVHVAYAPGADRADDARYAVDHLGGTTHVAVNQAMGAGTWVYLGTFRMAPGIGRVTLTNESRTIGRTVSADAARIGGGLGVISRGGETSGRPRWTEGSRLYEQWAGAPPTVFNVTGEADAYKDDYPSRGEWVNWLRASPRGGDGYGPENRRDDPGLGIPVDLALAFHTDAGQTDDSTTVGTLVIHHTGGLDGTGRFPDGSSRMATAELASRTLDTIVRDLRALYDPTWGNRGRRNRNYSEAARPNVPAVLLELLAHQNYEDMRFALDPRVRFDISRAIYKALGRSMVGPTRFVVQPLAPDGLSATFTAEGRVRLGWRPQPDPLEPSAMPDAYVVYRRVAPGGWDDGVLVQTTSVSLPAPAPGALASYRVAGVNAGGESAPSDVVAVGRAPDDTRTPVLVVAGFDRVAAPASVETVGLEGERRLGFDRARDPGVADGLDLLTVGDQMEFDRRRPWRTDDDPGHGASRGDLETTVLRGNTRDGAVTHGAALLAMGRSFVSASDEAIVDGAVPLTNYDVVDLALGLEKRTPWPRASDPRPEQFEALPAGLRARLDAFLDAGGHLVVSGAHWATDAATGGATDWLAQRLGVRSVGPQAADLGALVAQPAGASDDGLLPNGAAASFVTRASADALAVTRPDGLEAASDHARIALQYGATGVGAAVVHRGRDASAVSFAVPLEAIADPEVRTALLRAALDAMER